MHANGDIETIVGWERDKSVLPFMRATIPEDSITRTLIGNFIAPVEDLGGLNDLCFDPRDSTRHAFCGFADRSFYCKSHHQHQDGDSLCRVTWQSWL
jgi:hypothetical protein